MDFQSISEQKESYAKSELMSFVKNLKRAFTIFSIEVTFLAIGYCVYVIWNGYLITGIVIGDVLFWSFLAVLFLLNYFVISTRQEKVEEDQIVVKETFFGSTKKEQALKYLKVIGNLTSNQLANLLEIDVRNLSKFINPLISVTLP